MRVILSTDRGLVVLRFSKRAVELRGFIEVTISSYGEILWALRVYGSMVSFCCSVQFSGGSVIKRK